MNLRDSIVYQRAVYHRARRAVSLGAALLLIGPVSLCFAQSATPKAVLDKAVHDFGDINRGDKVTTEFQVRNTGKATLEISEVQTSCACTVVSYDKSIAPGSSGKITVELDATTIDGPSTQQIQVFTNDPDSPKLTLAVKATSQPSLAANPGYIRYIIVQGFDDEANDPLVSQKIYARTNPDFEIKKIDSPYPFIEATFRRPNEEESQGANKPIWIVETRISPDAAVGPLSGYLEIHTDHPKQKKLPIPVSGFVRPVFAATPQIAKFGDIDLTGEDKVQGSVQIRNFATERILITETDHDVDGMNVELKTDEEGRLYYAILTFDPAMKKGPFSGTVTFKTNSPRAPKVEFQVTGNVQ